MMIQNIMTALAIAAGSRRQLDYAPIKAALPVQILAKLVWSVNAVSGSLEDGSVKDSLAQGRVKIRPDSGPLKPR